MSYVKTDRFAAGLISTLLLAAPAAAQTPYEGSLFRDVWGQVSSDPYAALPQEEVKVTRFFSGLKDLMLDSSKRTLSNQSDLLPYFDKLVHPNGICLKGTWNITEANPYSGAFRVGTRAKIIARASTALTNTKADGNRAFGFAGKIFPTSDEFHGDPLKTANFFTIEDLGGTRKQHYMDSVNTNDIILISPSVTAFFKGLEGLVVARDFPLAEGSNLQTALIRELYPISELGLKEGETAVTPIWLKIDAADGMPRIDEADFRDELNLANYPGGLRFRISVASEGSRFGAKAWQTIGFIDVEESVVSESCDHRLHFSHPRARKIY
ncbi:MAG TPA: hypothetical protein VE954_02080 [Oligoflexus sp.]|uniref:hypothetical protein n=1 Tax=Oligoflexus sp. TaxID=1971216 RepID=UPI002D3B813C|nr:hypothetical protein [Oligoflexus sp.]HYX31874.1 hypothetical protein [Oligoflexus sp.]